MSRTIVHRTKGKLDLRALTVFGMNAKPETETPIGYFGTGLKYAIAVLSREKIPVTFWISGKQWVIEKDPTAFRGKPFDELYICSVSLGGLIKKRIKLPFTTELGKNWELWQAFRELEANTRDEKGETFIYQASDLEKDQIKGHTYITIEDERYVQCWLDRDKVFLPEGLTVRPDSNTRVQAFARKSQHVYYRGIRIHDLQEPSENTYNILSPITLTEDRTVKYTWEITNTIEFFLQEAESKEIVDRAIKAPSKTYESRLSYDYISISDAFLDRVKEAGDKATRGSKTIYDLNRPPSRVKETYTNWIRATIGAIEQGDYDAFKELASGEHRNELLNILRTAASTFEKEEINNNPEPETSMIGVLQDPQDIPF